MKRYYVPKIEEFHLGFECESNGVKTFIEYFNTNTLKKFISEGKYRVAHLSKEDIESEGWTWGSIQTDRHIYFKGSSVLVFLPDTNEIAITENIGGLKDVGEEKPIFYKFQGTIKNISEFRKLMVQLNIKK